jgi:hypothetical protein
MDDDPEPVPDPLDAIPSERPDPADAGSAEVGPATPTRAGNERAGRRPIIERIGMASIALVLGLLFGGVAAASFVGGELFLGAMAAIGCLMTFWAGVLTLVRG